MISISRQLDMPYEAMSLFKKFLTGEGFSPVWNQKVKIKTKLEEILKKHSHQLMELKEKHQKLLEIMFRKDEKMEISTEVAMVLSMREEDENLQKSTFAWLISVREDPSFSQEEENRKITDLEYHRILERLDIEKEEKWNLLLLYDHFSFYMEQFKELLTACITLLEEDLEELEKIVEEFYEDWEIILNREDAMEYIEEKFPLSMRNWEEDGVVIQPCIFAGNSIVWIEKWAFLGILFDSSYKSKKKLLSGEEVSRYLKVLGDYSKFKIVKALMKKAMYGKELSELLGLTPATISYHMSELGNAGIIKYIQGENKRIYYHVNQDLLDKIAEGVAQELGRE